MGKRSKGNDVTGYVVVDRVTGTFYAGDAGDGNEWTEDRLQSERIDSYEYACKLATAGRGAVLCEGTEICDRLELAATFSQIVQELDTLGSSLGDYSAVLGYSDLLQTVSMLCSMSDATYAVELGNEERARSAFARLAAWAIVRMHAIDKRIENEVLVKTHFKSKGTYPVRTKRKA